MGYIDSWVLDKDEDSVYDGNTRILHKVPSSVLVQFTETKWRNGTLVEEPCSWTIAGIDRPGVYPIFPWKRLWYLEQHRQNPKLEVKRFQLPLCPAYAMTAHSAQGRTLPACIIDLEAGRGVSIVASYVALTRVRHRTDLLIYRPFDLEPFQRGPPEGPSLLLRHL